MNTFKILFTCTILISITKPIELVSQFEIIPKIGINTSISNDINDQCKYFSNTPDYIFPQIKISFAKNLSSKILLNFDISYLKGKTDGSYVICVDDYSISHVEFDFAQVSPSIVYYFKNKLQIGIGFYNNYTLRANAEEVTIGGIRNSNIKHLVSRYNYGINLNLGFKTKQILMSIGYNHNLNKFYGNKIHWIGIDLGYRIKVK